MENKSSTDIFLRGHLDVTVEKIGDLFASWKSKTDTIRVKVGVTR
jgi:hypothetical protein